MNDILNDLWAGADMADTCIMLSTLIPTTNEELLENRPSINSQYTALVAQRAGEGKCIYLAEMDPGGVQWLQIDTDYVSTEIPHVHPNVSVPFIFLFYNDVSLIMVPGCWPCQNGHRLLPCYS